MADLPQQSAEDLQRQADLFRRIAGQVCDEMVSKRLRDFADELESRERERA
jgi:hypothetical protein